MLFSLILYYITVKYKWVFDKQINFLTNNLVIRAIGCNKLNKLFVITCHHTVCNL